MLEQVDLGAIAIDRAVDGLSVALLGGFSVSVGPRAIEPAAWRLRKAGHLLKLLALAPRHRMHREQVLDTLWPHLDVDAASNNLRVTLHFARKLLEPESDSGPGALQMRGDLLVLCSDFAIQVDVDRFEEAAQVALRSDDPAAYAAALDLYGGELLPEDRFEDWAIERRESLRAVHLGLLQNLARLCEERGELHQAIETLRRALRNDPASEPANVALMRLSARTGQRAQALRQYQQMREALQRELDVEPEPETTRLYEAILTGSFDAGEPPTPVTTARTPAPERARPAKLHAVPRAPRSNLPAQLTSFIGRERELAALRETLAGTRLVTLTGPGGSGKTRLALEVSSALLETYRDGVWLVDLTGLTDPALVPRTVGVALQVQDAAGRSAADALSEALAGKQMLLVLDNCEHLVAACAALADHLLHRCPELRMLATSREPLRVPGEAIWPVPALAVPDPNQAPDLDLLSGIDAVRLFVERARLHSPGFALTAGNAAATAAVCRGLDGMPLAIELAAARTRSLPLGQIAARLDAALPLLTGGSRTGPAHHRSMQATIAWSYDLLSAPERRLFARLAVFAGGFTIEAAEAVCADELLAGEHILDLLFQLTDKSLLVVEERDGEVRYRLLEPIRQYGLEQLVATEGIDVARSRHCLWCLGLVAQAEPELWGAEQAIWLNRLETEHDNLRAALAWCLEREAETGLRLAGQLWWFWRVRGYFTEGRRWLEGLLARTGERTPHHAQALLGTGILAAFQGDRAAARPLLEDSLTLSQERGDTRGVGWALANLGLLALSEEDNAGAQSLLERGLALLQEIGDQHGMAWTMDMLGDLGRVRGDYSHASERYHQSLTIRRELGDTRGIGWQLAKLGNVTRIQGYYQQAHPLLDESLALARATGDRWDIAWALEYKGILAQAEANDRWATLLLNESLTIFQQIGDRLGSASCLAYYGVAIVRQADYERGVRVIGAAIAHQKPLGIWLTAAERATQEAALASARSMLHADVFLDAWQEGQAMTLEQAVAEALAGQPGHV